MTLADTLCRAMTTQAGLVPSLLRSSREELAEEELGSPALQKFLYPDAEELPPQESLSMPIWDHLDELRERVLVAGLACTLAVLTCFCFSKDLVVFLEAPVADSGVRFLQLSPGEFFFTTLKASDKVYVLRLISRTTSEAYSI